MNRIDLTPVYILHTRPFRNTSLLVELFSQTHGRIAAVARSARGLQSRYKGQLQLFTPLLASWIGNHELKTLTQIELNGMPLQLNHKPLFCAFYLNELLMRVLHKEDPHPKLFDLYHDCLRRLEKKENMSAILRFFEKKLLEHLGYGLPFEHEANMRKPLQPDLHYRYIPQQGFIVCDATEKQHTDFSGADLLLMAAEQFEDINIASSAKRLMRLALSPLLGVHALNSRELF